MSSRVSDTIFGMIIIGIIVFLIILLLAGIFHWSIVLPPIGSILDIGMLVIALLWQLFIIKVPWDLYFQSNQVLFDMQNSREKQIPINEDRYKYVKSLRWRLLACAIGAHLASAAVIAGLTYWSNARVGYFFAFLYILTTLFRPAIESYRYLRNKLHEIREEVKVPREDALKLRQDLDELKEEMRYLKERVTQDEERIIATEEQNRNLLAGQEDLHTTISRAEKTMENRIRLLTNEVERTLAKAFDQQDVVNGLRAFARLIKEA